MFFDAVNTEVNYMKNMETKSFEAECAKIVAGAVIAGVSSEVTRRALNRIEKK